MINITEEMQKLVDNALKDGFPCILATSSSTGEPGVGYRGSMMIYDDETLAYWERTKRAGLEHIEANPQVIIMFRNPTERKAWKFHGVATVHKTGPIREEIKAKTVQPELDRDPEDEGYAVTIKVTRIMTMGGEIVQER